MNKIIGIVAGIALVIASLVVIFFYGKHVGASEIEAKVINNTELVRKIAEVSTIEARGTAHYHQTNVVEETGALSMMQNALFEKTIDVRAPFVAKYGIDMGKGPTEIKTDGKTIFVSLPEPEMTSFDLKADSVTEMSERGWVSFQRDDTYVTAIAELTKDGRSSAANDKNHLRDSKEQTAEFMTLLFAPLGKPVRVSFDGVLYEMADSIPTVRF